MKSFQVAGCLSVVLLASLQGIFADTVMSSVGVIPRHLAAHTKATQLSLDTLSGSTTFEQARVKAAQLQAALNDNHDEAMYNLFMAWAHNLEQYFADEAEVTASYEAFVKSVKDMVHHNLNTQQSHWRGLNKFSGGTRSLFTLKTTYGVTGKCPGTTLGKSTSTCTQSAGADPPKYDVNKPVTPAIDFRAKGQTSAVKNQGSGCNGAWANAAATAIDSAFSIASGNTPLPVSRQEILSCLNLNTLPGSNSNGCSGGNTNDAIDFLQLNTLTAESTYPYTSASGAVAACASKYLTLNQTNPGNVPWVGLGCPSNCGTSGYQGFQKANADFLVRAVGGSAIVGTAVPSLGQPVITYWSFLLHSDPTSYDTEFLSYAGGIFTGSQCYPVAGTVTDLQYLNHIMVIVGYNLSAPVPYWTLQNSFGASWGQGGLIQVAYTSSKVGPCGMYALSSGPNLNFISGHIPKKPISNTCIDGSRTKKCPLSVVEQCATLSNTACLANAVCNAPPYNFCAQP